MIKNSQFVWNYLNEIHIVPQLDRQNMGKAHVYIIGGGRVLVDTMIHVGHDEDIRAALAKLLDKEDR
jgi:hypothetical protein